MEDPYLTSVHSNQSDKYGMFWKKCEAYLQECTAVHEHGHDNATYLAHAISVRDVVEQVRYVLKAR